MNCSEMDVKPSSAMKSLLPVVPHEQAPPHLPLSVLIEFAVHRVYQRLTVLAELLAKKSDVDRKISSLEFAHQTRTLFVQLLALVKWLKTIASRVEICTVSKIFGDLINTILQSIDFFVRQQSDYFVETADKLVFLARDELHFAK